MTTGDVARATGYSIPWVRARIDDGQLRAECYAGRRGRRAIRIRVADFWHFRDTWLRATR